MRPLDYMRCGNCHNPSCEGCDNHLKLTRADFFQLITRDAIITRIWLLSKDVESIKDCVLDASDGFFDEIAEHLDEIKDSLYEVVKTLDRRMDDFYFYEEDKS